MGNELTILGKDGKIKSKEDFLKEVAALYDEAKENQDKLGDMEDDIQFMDIFRGDRIPSPETALDKCAFLERKVYIDAAITQETGQPVLQLIQFWNSEDEFNGTPVEKRMPIQVYIDSPGGSLTTSFLIVDAIKNSKTPVYTVAVGTAYSGGFFILIAGHKRLGFPNSTYLYHQGSATITGDAHNVELAASFYNNYQMKQIKNHVLGSTKITDELYEKHIKDDWWIGAKKAKKLGIIDEICTDVNGGIYNEQED